MVTGHSADRDEPAGLDKSYRKEAQDRTAQVDWFSLLPRTHDARRAGTSMLHFSRRCVRSGHPTYPDRQTGSRCCYTSFSGHRAGALKADANFSTEPASSGI